MTIASPPTNDEGEKKPETSKFHGKHHETPCFPVDFLLNQSIEASPDQQSVATKPYKWR